MRCPTDDNVLALEAGKHGVLIFLRHANRVEAATGSANLNAWRKQNFTKFFKVPG